MKLKWRWKSVLMKTNEMKKHNENNEYEKKILMANENNGQWQWKIMWNDKRRNNVWIVKSVIM